LQKALEQMSLKLTEILSDVTGGSPRGPAGSMVYSGPPFDPVRTVLRDSCRRPASPRSPRGCYCSHRPCQPPNPSRRTTPWPPPPPDDAVEMAAPLQLFKDKVRPSLQATCLKCHGGEKTKSGFSLTDRESLLAGGTRGPAVVVGKGADSQLVRSVARKGEPHMPPDRPAPKEAVEFLARWIDLGAAYDRPLVEGPEAKQTRTVTGQDR